MPAFTTNRLFPMRCMKTPAEAGVITGPGSFYPLILTKDELIELYFRAKELTFNMSLSYSYDNMGNCGTANPEFGFVGSGNLSAVDSIMTRDGLTDEKSFLCTFDITTRKTNSPWTTTHSEFVNTRYDFDPPFVFGEGSGPMTGVFTINVFNTGSGGPVLIDGDDYYPQFRFDSAMSGVLGSQSLWIRSGYLMASPPATVLGDFNLDILGKTITIRSYLNPCNGVLLTSSASCEMSKWFEYNPDDGGGPIWDEDTGSQLRNPFSVQP